MIVPAYRIAIAVATNVSDAENASLLTTRLADAFIRYLDGAGSKQPKPR
jgi:hypothetical protein